jgi:hypothetical protein
MVVVVRVPLEVWNGTGTARPRLLRISGARKSIGCSCSNGTVCSVRHLFCSIRGNSHFGLVLRPARCKFVKDPRGRGHSVCNHFREARRGPQSANGLRDIFCNQPPEFLVACARRSTGRGGSSRRRLLGRRWGHSRGRSRSRRRGRGGSRSRAWFTATVHHAHFSSAALADRDTHLGVRYADAIDQLASQTTSLANWNDRIVRLLKWGVRHTLC